VSSNLEPDHDGKPLGGRFVLTRMVGSGATADVYQAVDLALNRTVALKMIHPRVTDDPVLTARVREEVALARELVHPSIVRVYEHLVIDPRMVVVMDYLSGGDLRSHILLRGSLPPAEVVTLAESLLDALEYAHGRGIVHRDVKPRNVLYSESGEAQLSDFGLARSMSSAGLDSTERVAGTPEYTAPETVTASLWDPRSDLYAVGCTLFEALIGHPPYSANTPAEILRLQVESPIPPLPKDVEHEHTALAILITALLAKDPNERPQSAREARQILHGGARVTGPGTDSRRCPLCGAPMSSRYDWCFTCRKPSLPVSTVKSGGTTVIVTGPGRTAEKLAAHLRDACLDIAVSLGLGSEKMAKGVPRLPFVFARGLDRGSAIRLMQELEAAGLVAILVGPGDLPRREAFRLLGRKVVSMAPRVYLAFFGGGYLMMNNVMRFHGGAFAAVAGTIIIGVPVALAFSYRRSLARGTGEALSGSRPELNQLLVSVGDPLIHARVKNVVEAATSLERTVARDAGVPGELKEDLHRLVEESVERAAALGMALNRAREGASYARHEASLERTTDLAPSDESVAIVRKMDSVYTQALEAIGRVALDIHGTALRLARTSEQFGERELAALGRSVEQLADRDSGWREIEAELAGGAQ
jgi:tRNA A-37 threonylcarbamoyl transferase component Bud32